MAHARAQTASSICFMFGLMEDLTLAVSWKTFGVISSRRHRRWDGGSYGFRLGFFLASSFAYNFVRK